MKYYVVLQWHQPGIYSTWDECKWQVHGYPWAVYKSFNNHDAALAARKEQWFWHKWQSSQTYLRTVMGGEYDISICTDAACPSNPGPIEYRAVDIATNTELFVRWPYAGWSTNLAEFLWIVEWLQWMVIHNIDYPKNLKTILYTDSKIALSRVKQWSINTSIPRDSNNALLFEKIDLACDRLKHNPQRSQQLTLKKRPTSQWGQIPADFWRK